MGFSVSGATALLLIAFLAAFGTFYAASTGAFDQVQEAQVDQTGEQLDTINTNIEKSVSYNASAGELTINATNTGSTTLRLANTDLLVDGEFITDWQDNATVQDTADRTLWQPQERLSITLEREFAPDRIKLVTEHGVATTDLVEDDIENLNLELNTTTANQPVEHNWTWESVDVECTEDDCIDTITLQYEDIDIDNTELFDPDNVTYAVAGNDNVNINDVTVSEGTVEIDVDDDTSDPSDGIFLELRDGLTNPDEREEPYKAQITFETTDSGVEHSVFGKTTYEIEEEN